MAGNGWQGIGWPIYALFTENILPHTEIKLWSSYSKNIMLQIYTSIIPTSLSLYYMYSEAPLEILGPKKVYHIGSETQTNPTVSICLGPPSLRGPLNHPNSPTTHPPVYKLNWMDHLCYTGHHQLMTAISSDWPLISRFVHNSALNYTCKKWSSVLIVIYLVVKCRLCWSLNSSWWWWCSPPVMCLPLPLRTSPCFQSNCWLLQWGRWCWSGDPQGCTCTKNTIWVRSFVHLFVSKMTHKTSTDISIIFFFIWT